MPTHFEFSITKQFLKYPSVRVYHLTIIHSFDISNMIGFFYFRVTTQMPVLPNIFAYMGLSYRTIRLFGTLSLSIICGFHRQLSLSSSVCLAALRATIRCTVSLDLLPRMSPRMGTRDFRLIFRLIAACNQTYRTTDDHETDAD